MVDGQVGAVEPGHEPGPEGLDAHPILGRRLAPRAAALADRVRGIDDQHAFAGVDARARVVGRKNEAPEHRAGPIRPQRQLHGSKAVIPVQKPPAVGLWLPIRVEGQPVGVDAGIGGDGCGNDLALDLEALDLR